MANAIEVQNQKILDKITNHQIGEVAYCREENKYFVMTEEGWNEVKAQMEGDGIKMSLYDINKQVIGQLADYTDEQKNDLMKAIKIWKETKKEDRYFLLYGKEISYFTLFVENDDSLEIHDEDTFESLVLECLNGAFKAIKDYDVQTDAIEIWVTDENDEVTVLYLFSYQRGVVGYRG